MDNMEMELTDSDDEREMLARNWRKHLLDVQKTALRDGATSSEPESDVMFQMGFDSGYNEGFKRGYEQGSYNSTMRLLKQFNMSEDNEQDSVIMSTANN